MKKLLEEFDKTLKSSSPIVSGNGAGNIIREWKAFLKHQSSKNLTPLFITGAGVSMDAKDKDGNKIPSISGIIELLAKNAHGTIDDKPEFKYVKDLLSEFNENLEKHTPPSRVLFQHIYNAFQTEQGLRAEWIKCNRSLISIIGKVETTAFHKLLADFYQSFNAINLTLNFDGLLVQELLRRELNAFSLPTPAECESFFIRNGSNSNEEYAEIQLRGDILYLKCDNPNFCTQKNKAPTPFVNPYRQKNSKNTNSNFKEPDIKCPGCGKEMLPFLSFPGSYSKEKEMRDMLQVVWKYISQRVSCITVIGVSGSWDPLIIGFIGDLLNERNIPLLVIDPLADNNDKQSLLIKELILPRTHKALAIALSGDGFAFQMNEVLEEDVLPKMSKINYRNNRDIKDSFWPEKTGMISNSFSEFEERAKGKIKKLGESAQLGLKSYWLKRNVSDVPHNRLEHSIGVTQIASWLYEKAKGNSGFIINDNEKQFLRIAALLHDAGHLPFSHLIEEVFEELHWGPGSYKPLYSHVLLSENKINELFGSDSDLQGELDRIGYSKGDLVRLINGNFGVGYLDAILNSAIDADKIDYVFRDAFRTNRNITLDPKQFLNDISEKISITPANFLSFSGISSKAAFDLLKNRNYLYKELYFQPAFRILDGITKHIITSYFVHFLNYDDDETWRNVKNYNKNIYDSSKTDISDLGLYKILFSINQLSQLAETNYEDDSNGIEYNVLKSMFERLRDLKCLNKVYRDFLISGFEIITKTQGETEIKKLESQIQIERIENVDFLEKMKEVAKTCKLRMPGVYIIDVKKDTKFLSIAEERKEKVRSDDTSAAAECILVPKGNCENWNATDKATIGLLDSQLKNQGQSGFTVYIYSPLPDKEYKALKARAMNLYERLKAKEQDKIPQETD